MKYIILITIIIMILYKLIDLLLEIYKEYKYKKINKIVNQLYFFKHKRIYVEDKINNLIKNNI